MRQAVLLIAIAGIVVGPFSSYAGSSDTESTGAVNPHIQNLERVVKMLRDRIAERRSRGLKPSSGIQTRLKEYEAKLSTLKGEQAKPKAEAAKTTEGDNTKLSGTYAAAEANDGLIQHVKRQIAFIKVSLEGWKKSAERTRKSGKKVSAAVLRTITAQEERRKELYAQLEERRGNLLAAVKRDLAKDAMRKPSEKGGAAARAYPPGARMYIWPDSPPKHLLTTKGKELWPTAKHSKGLTVKERRAAFEKRKKLQEKTQALRRRKNQTEVEWKSWLAMEKDVRQMGLEAAPVTPAEMLNEIPTEERGAWNNMHGWTVKHASAGIWLMENASIATWEVVGTIVCLQEWKVFTGFEVEHWARVDGAWIPVRATISSSFRKERNPPPLELNQRVRIVFVMFGVPRMVMRSDGGYSGFALSGTRCISIDILND